MWTNTIFLGLAALVAITHADVQGKIIKFRYTVQMHQFIEEDLIEKLELGLEELKLTRTFPSYLNDTLRQLEVPHFFRRSDPIDIGFDNEQTYGGKILYPKPKTQVKKKTIYQIRPFARFATLRQTS